MFLTPIASEEPTMTPPEILLFGDGAHLFRSIGWVLEYKGFRVRAAASPEAAIEALVKENFDLVIARVTMGESDGMEVLKRAKRLNPQVKVMVVSGSHDLAFPLEAYEIEVDDYLSVPISPLELWRRVSSCLAVAVEGAQASQGRGSEINGQAWNRLMLMFHDLRGGLVATEASLKLLLRGTYGPVEEDVAARLKEMSARVKNLTRLTSEFVGRVAAGSREIGSDREVLDLQKDVIDPVLKEFAGEIRDQGVTIDNRLNGAAIPLKGSRLGLQGVFRNLLANGIKYGGRDCTIAIDLENAGDYWRLKVYNSGRPIPEEYRGRLFIRQGSRPRRAADRGGLGLGLYLSRDVIQNHGGDLWYEARGDGSNFVVSLPQP
jgi:two-component system sensor histidine kinase/response regulator